MDKMCYEKYGVSLNDKIGEEYRRLIKEAVESEKLFKGLQNIKDIGDKHDFVEQQKHAIWRNG